MKAKLFFYAACVVAALMAWNIMKTGKIPGVKEPESNGYQLDQPAQAVRYSTPLKCSLTHITVVSVEDKAAVDGSNYLVSYKSVIEPDNGLKYPVHFITDGDTGPWAQGQRFALLGSCEEISPKDLEATRAKFAQDIQVKENECVGVFYWDTKLHQVSRQCGQSLGDFFYLGWDNRKKQAPANK
jgi:hypothetical protein